jgi:hypothetical protein
MPVDLFEKFGVNPNAPAQAPQQAATSGPVDLFEKFGVTPQPPKPYNPVQDYARNAATGNNQIYNAMWGAGHALGQIPAHAAQLMGFPNAAQAIGNTFTAPPPGLGGTLGGIAGEGLGFAGLGLPLRGAMAAAELPGMAGQLMNALGSSAGAGGAAGRILGSAGFGALQNPNNPQAGAAVGGGIGSLAEALPISSVLKGAQLLGHALTGTTSPEAEAFYAMGRGLPVVPKDFGEHYRNVLGNMPLSGVQGNLNQIREAHDALAQQITKQMGAGAAPADMAAGLGDAIKENANKFRQQANEKYQNLADVAVNTGAKVETPINFQEAAKSFLERPLGNIPSDIKKSLETYSEHPEMEFPQAINLRQQLNAQARNDSDRYTRSIAGSLSEALRSDIGEAAQKTGNPKIIDALNTADQFYRNEYVPYQSTLSTALSKGKKNLEQLPNALLQDTEHTNKIVGDLSPEQRQQALLLRFKAAQSENPLSGEYITNPGKLSASYQRLSEAQKQKMLTPEVRNLFNQLDFLSKQTLGPTYARPISRAMGTTGADIAADAFHNATEGNAGGLLKGLALGGAGATYGRLMQNLLTNPAFGKAYMSANLGAVPQQVDLLRQLMTGGAIGTLSPRQPLDLGTLNRYQGTQ